MARSKAFKAAGTKFYFGNAEEVANVSAWTSVAEIIDINGPKEGRNMIEVTHMNSDDDEEEFIAGKRTRGSITLPMNFVPSDFFQNPVTGMISLRDSGLPKAAAIVYSDPDQTTWMCAVLVEDFEVTARQGDKVSANVTLKPTGPRTWTDGGVL